MLNSTVAMKRQALGAWDRVRALVAAPGEGATDWRNVLDELARHSGADVLFSTIGSGSESWRSQAVRLGGATVAPVGGSGLRIMARGKESAHLQWTGFSPQGPVVLNLLI